MDRIGQKELALTRFQCAKAIEKLGLTHEEIILFKSLIVVTVGQYVFLKNWGKPVEIGILNAVEVGDKVQVELMELWEFTVVLVVKVSCNQIAHYEVLLSGYLLVFVVDFSFCT